MSEEHEPMMCKQVTEQRARAVERVQAYLDARYSPGVPRRNIIDAVYGVELWATDLRSLIEPQPADAIPADLARMVQRHDEHLAGLHRAINTVDREVSHLRTQAARGCDGCQFYEQRSDTHGACQLPYAAASPVMLDSPTTDPINLVVEAAHYCASWHGTNAKARVPYIAPPELQADDTRKPKETPQ